MAHQACLDWLWLPLTPSMPLNLLFLSWDKQYTRLKKA